MRVDGKVALVTGTGSGLGQVTAIALAQSGADLALTELPGKEDLAEATAAEIRKLGRRAVVVSLDVRKVPMIREAVDRVLRAYERIDILVNNAGINIAKWATDVTEEDWDNVLDINLKGVFFCSQTVANKSMIPRRSGRIINIASQNGVIGYFYRAAYCSSKAGVVNLTRVLAIEWAKYGINVNAVGPTFVYTPLTAKMFEDEAFKADVLSRIPLGRLAKPEDVVGAVVFLASPAADMVTGHTLLVDGGWTAL